MNETFWALYVIRQPITGLRPEHLKSVLRCLETYYEDTRQLPSAEAYLELVRHAVKNTVLEGE